MFWFRTTPVHLRTKDLREIGTSWSYRCESKCAMFGFFMSLIAVEQRKLIFGN
jgi:hypothetical protein